MRPAMVVVVVVVPMVMVPMVMVVVVVVMVDVGAELTPCTTARVAGHLNYY